MSHKRHGLCKRRVYSSWQHMKNRCRNKANVKYSNYGGAGIRMCDRWIHFENFLSDMGEPPTESHSIDRIDGTRGYEPENCRWATNVDQHRNKSSCRQISYLGKTQPLIVWIEELGLNEERVRARIKRGWSPTRAFTTDLAPKERGKSGRFKSPIAV